MAANVQAMSVQFKNDLLNGTHSLTTSSNTINAALALINQSISGSTLQYSAGWEVSGAGYSAGGVAVTNGTAPTYSGTTAYWTPSANIVYNGVTLTSAFDTVALYYTADNHAIGFWNFGSTTITAGTLTLNMPTNAAGTALIQLN